MANDICMTLGVEPQYLTRLQASIFTGLADYILDGARERKELKFYRIGKQVLYKRADLENWVETHLVELTLGRYGRESETPENR